MTKPAAVDRVFWPAALTQVIKREIPTLILEEDSGCIRESPRSLGRPDAIADSGPRRVVEVVYIVGVVHIPWVTEHLGRIVIRLGNHRVIGRCNSYAVCGRVRCGGCGETRLPS